MKQVGLRRKAIRVDGMIMKKLLQLTLALLLLGTPTFGQRVIRFRGKVVVRLY